MADTTTAAVLSGVNATVAIVAYISAAVGLIFILGLTFCILRRIRLRRARKYIKQQRNHTIGMGPVLTSAPPTAPWKWKEVKANIKARHRGEERPYPNYGRKPEVSIISNGVHSNGSSNGVSRPQSANGVGRPQSANGVGRPQSATSVSLGPSHKKVLVNVDLA